MTDLLPDAPREYRFSVQELILQVQRELAYRERVYGRLVSEHRMKHKDRERGFAMCHAWIKALQMLPPTTLVIVPAP